MRRLLESVTILPIVIPPVVLIIGVLQVMPLALRASVWMLGLEYVILAMPFAYRALDAGLRAIDVKTLTEASSSLGGGLFTTLWRVLLPNLRTAVLSATILIVALVLGEFTMASLSLKETFPVWIVLFDQLNANISVAASILRPVRDLDLPDADHGHRHPPVAPHRRRRGDAVHRGPPRDDRKLMPTNELAGNETTAGADRVGEGRHLGRIRGRRARWHQRVAAQPHPRVRRDPGA